MKLNSETFARQLTFASENLNPKKRKPVLEPVALFLIGFICGILFWSAF